MTSESQYKLPGESGEAGMLSIDPQSQSQPQPKTNDPEKPAAPQENILQRSQRAMDTVSTTTYNFTNFLYSIRSMFYGLGVAISMVTSMFGSSSSHSSSQQSQNDQRQ